MSNQIGKDQYKGSFIEKGITEKKVTPLNELDYKQLDQVEKGLTLYFEKGLMSYDTFQNELDKIDVVKAGRLSNNGKLVPVHIIDKNGKHTVKWKSPEEADNHKKVGEGHTVTYKGDTHTVHKVKSDGYWTLKDQNGKKHDKSPNRLDVHKPGNMDGDKKETPKVEEPKLSQHKVTGFDSKTNTVTFSVNGKQYSATSPNLESKEDAQNMLDNVIGYNDNVEDDFKNSGDQSLELKTETDGKKKSGSSRFDELNAKVTSGKATAADKKELMNLRYGGKGFDGDKKTRKPSQDQEPIIIAKQLMQDLSDAFEEDDFEDTEKSEKAQNEFDQFMADAIEEYGITEKQFNEAAKDFIGLDFVYEDYAKKPKRDIPKYKRPKVKHQAIKEGEHISHNNKAVGVTGMYWGFEVKKDNGDGTFEVNQASKGYGGLIDRRGETMTMTKNELELHKKANAQSFHDKKHDRIENAHNFTHAAGVEKIKGGDLKNPSVVKEFKEAMSKIEQEANNLNTESDSVGAAAGWSGTMRSSRSGTALSFRYDNVHRGGQYGFDRMYAIQAQIGGALPIEDQNKIQDTLKQVMGKFSYKSELGKSSVQTSDGSNWSSVMIVAPSGDGKYTPFRGLKH